MRCPGQDMRYWKGDAAFEVPCPVCGSAVEIFRDEPSGRCRSCGHKFKNPKTDPACAKWCAYAEQCLGFAPQRESSANLEEGALASLLIQAVYEEFKKDQIRIARALAAFQRAKELAWKEGGDPRVVLAAALFLEVGTEQTRSDRVALTDGPKKVRKILQRVGLDEETIARVCHIVESLQRHQDADTIEFRIVRESAAYARGATEDPRTG